MPTGYPWSNWSPWTFLRARIPWELESSAIGVKELFFVNESQRLDEGRAIDSSVALRSSKAERRSSLSPSLRHVEETTTPFDDGEHFQSNYLSPEFSGSPADDSFRPLVACKRKSRSTRKSDNARHSETTYPAQGGKSVQRRNSDNARPSPPRTYVNDDSLEDLAIPGSFRFKATEEDSASTLSYLSEDEREVDTTDFALQSPSSSFSSTAHHRHDSILEQEDSDSSSSEIASISTSGREARDAKWISENASYHEILITGTFRNGQKLKHYQLDDLRRLVKRETGEKVCDTDVVNNVGLLLAYEPGLGKTVATIALILANPPSQDFQGARPTLVLVPNQPIMDHWTKEIEKFAPGLDVCCFKSGKSELRLDAEVVASYLLLIQHDQESDFQQLITYSQLLLQFKARERSPIFRYTWYRLACDESDKFRNPATKIADAVCALRKLHGLCLTGTPVQNSALDMYPLLKFLQVTYEGVNDQGTFRRIFCSKTQREQGLAETVLDLVKKDFCIFRFKDKVAEDLDAEEPGALLPPLTEKIVKVELSPVERMVYNGVKSLKLHPLGQIMRRRQACNHPLLVQETLGSVSTAESNEEGRHSSSRAIRGSKLRSDSQIKRLAKIGGDAFSDSFRSAKLVAMLRILEKCKDQKTIIFTHFTDFIPAIASALYGANICWAEYTGGMTLRQQIQALRQIANDKQCSVIIISIFAGNTVECPAHRDLGLHITSCNNVILMEPWWNPFSEDQAVGRVYRMGQPLPVSVYRLVVKDSIEESILETQQLKREMMKDLVHGNTLEDHSEPLDEATQQAWLERP